ncbi:MAG: GNAT family N-acetyltransferase [Polyangiales bacterium]
MEDESPKPAAADADAAPKRPRGAANEPMIRVRRIHRRDLNRAWEFLKLSFRGVNRETVEYQRPRSKRRFLEVYEEEGVEQLLFEAGAEGDGAEIVGYAECAAEITGSDNWMNENFFTRRGMRPMFVEELAVHPDYQGRGVGSFVLEQLEHLARVRGCTHLVLEVAENNKRAMTFYRARHFQKLDAAVFMARRVDVDDELLPPRALKKKPAAPATEAPAKKDSASKKEPAKKEPAAKKGAAKKKPAAG